MRYRNYYNKFLRKLKMLTREENDKLFHEYKKARETKDFGLVEKIREQLIVGNIGLIFPHIRTVTRLGMGYYDALQEGIVGLMIAVNKFNPERGAAFSTYARYRIAARIRRSFLDDEQSIRIPIYMVEFNREMYKIFLQYHEKFNRNPTKEEIVVLTGKEEWIVNNAFKYGKISVTSLDKLIGECESGETDKEVNGCLNTQNNNYYYYIADKKIIGPDLFVDSQKELQNITAGINALLEKIKFFSEYEQGIFKKFYGLDGSFKLKTLEEVGRECQTPISRERVRQIINKIWNRFSGYNKDKVKENKEKLLSDLDRRTILIEAIVSIKA